MPVVTFLGTEYPCSVAYKGDGYVHLVDENGVMIAAFDGVVNFSAFSITDGDWSIPTRDDDCYVAVIREDGTIAKGGHRCSDIGTGGGGSGGASATHCQINLSAASSVWTVSDGIYTRRFYFPGVRATDFFALEHASLSAWARSYLDVTVEADYVVVSTPELPPSDIVLHMCYIKTSGTVVLS